MANSNGSPRGFVGKLVDSLENRLILLLVATILGIGGNLAIIKSDPQTRADPFTGTQGRILIKRVDSLEDRCQQHLNLNEHSGALIRFKYMDKEIRELKEEIRQLKK